MAHNPGGIAAERLLSFIQRVERLEEEKRQLQADIKSVYDKAKSAGFDTKVMRAMVKERRMEEADRQEWQALCEVYRAALGMLDGTPLGDSAKRRLMGEPPAPPQSLGGKLGNDPEPAPMPAEAGPAAPTPEDLLAARAQGAAAAKAGKPVLANPFDANDPRRASWDEGWCSAAGSDGMEIPPAFRRSKKPGKGDAPGKGA